jgi:hypothetical protein
MKGWGIILLAAAVAAAGCDDSSTAPSNLPIVFTAQLSPANEVPPVANAESVGRGAAQITIVPTRDSSGAITGGAVTYYFQLFDFPGNTEPVAAHIHNAVAGVNGAIVNDTGLTAATGLDVGNDGRTQLTTTTTISAAVLNGILANPSTYYFNVHSRVNPGGFARGQLVRVQ